jgi:hypothetical protein
MCFSPARSACKAETQTSSELSATIKETSGNAWLLYCFPGLCLKKNSDLYFIKKLWLLQQAHQLWKGNVNYKGAALLSF